MKVLFSLFMMSNLLFAVSLSPLIQTLDSKRTRNVIFKITNPSKEPVASTFSILKVLSTVKNKEEREETKMVEAYPTKFVLDAGETKSIRVRYMGQKLPETEEVYRVIAKELDIDVSDNENNENKGKINAQIKMRFSYEGLLFVKEENSKPKLKINSINKSMNEVTLIISNSGTASVVPNPKDYHFLISTGKNEYKLTLEDLKEAEFRRVLAGKTNTFHLKNITSVPVDKIVSMRLEKK
ncbi:MAG: Sigma-fimbriae chaperone protein [uncultured Sulfurovum sp.]|uniref:Sigma-fimbriae chaperone protein n=1 Tax=uncultured Sulfurovum sp. TaxID=269237 RepID=A0A6S6S851_9BACT|nr:MAG: Sigma-fimbriae chaperone protein [uncultured Sulfurovum sp.]